MIVWSGPWKLRVVAAPMARTSPARSAARISSRMRRACWRPCHSASDRSRYFSVTISRIGPTFWAMPPWTRTRLSWSAWRAGAGGSSGPERRGAGGERPAGAAELGAAGRGGGAPDQLAAGPGAAGVLPAAAGAAQPLAQDRPRRHQPPFVLLQRAGQRLGLTCGPHAHGDQGGQQVG